MNENKNQSPKEKQVHDTSEKMWCCSWLNWKGEPVFRMDTLSYSRKYSIEKAIDGSKLSWRQAKIKHQWKCQKVKLLITSIT